MANYNCKHTYDNINIFSLNANLSFSLGSYENNDFD